MRKTWRESLTAYAFLAPAGAVLTVFWLVPVMLAFYLSFTNFELGDTLIGGGDKNYNMVGWRNYDRLFNTETGDFEDFTASVYATVNFVLWSVPLTLVAGLGMAMLLNNALKGIGIFRTIFFLPHITTWVAIAIVWKFLYNEHLGLANYLLKDLLGAQPLKWLNEPTGVVQLMLQWIGFKFDAPLHPLLGGPSLAMFSIILTTVWYDTGYFMLIFLAGLQGIDKSYYEAAAMDGANAFKRFRYITLPLLMPVTFFLMTISLINAFKEFIPMLIMTPTGGPNQTTRTLAFFLYEKAFTNGKLGYGAAIAFVVLLIILFASYMQRLIMGNASREAHA